LTINDNTKMAIEELRRLYEIHSKSADSLDSKAGTILGSASLIVSLFTILKLDLTQPSQNWYYIIAVILIFLTYIFLIIKTIFAIRPQEYSTPLDHTEMEEILQNQTIENASQSLIIGYRNAIASILNVIKKRSDHLLHASYSLAVIVILLIITSFIPR